MRRRLAGTARDTNLPELMRLARRPSPEEISAVVCRRFGVSEAELGASRRHGNDARVAAVYLAQRLTGTRVEALVERFGNGSPAGIWKLLQRAEQRRRHDRGWDRLLDELQPRVTAPE